jgi:hypothetical protein
MRDYCILFPSSGLLGDVYNPRAGDEDGEVDLFYVRYRNGWLVCVQDERSIGFWILSTTFL